MTSQGVNMAQLAIGSIAILSVKSSLFAVWT